MLQVQKEIDDLLGGPTPLKFSTAHPECFAQTQTVTLGANTLSITGAVNGEDWKRMLPFTVESGTLFKDSDVEIVAAQQKMKYLVRTMIKFSRGYNQLDVQISNTEELTSSMDIQCSPVRYAAGEPP